ncbi:HAD superfamily hydrolase (TIGR01484 family) [Humibacillus xanthopallidus]|uniref:HAD superfamily hydrolase (TIGR01484 family) n=1 Tax=Humibacillus xanthopallidus TaxID=412689 RepID=A0A543PLI8_9MICO|nr:HAD hydrolase family protein [Humibacillus xanthopallidus]TQN44935.1 HAD superfamily hydrolase (TIGR01484 family) [Humibacillus xanthopallidus]
MAQRLLALDLDGTTLNHMGELSPAVRDAIAALPEEVSVVVATGRSIIATTPILEALGLREGYAVCSNGALTIALEPGSELGYSVIDMVTFDPWPVLEKLRVALPDALIAVEEPGIGFKVSRHFPDGELMGHSREVDWDELVAHPVTRVTLRQPESSAEDFMELVERAGLHEVSYAVGWSAWLDINPEGVSKASALELVRRHLQVEPAHTIACGDQRNDLEMLHWAAWGVAMGNAPDQVKAIADEVTGHVDDDGLVPVVEAVSEAVRAGVTFREGVASAATARLEL